MAAMSARSLMMVERDCRRRGSEAVAANSTALGPTKLAVVEMLVAELDHADAGLDERPHQPLEIVRPNRRPSTSTHSRTPSSRSRLVRPMSIAFSSV